MEACTENGDDIFYFNFDTGFQSAVRLSKAEYDIRKDPKCPNTRNVGPLYIRTTHVDGFCYIFSVCLLGSWVFATKEGLILAAALTLGNVRGLNACN